MTSPASIDPLNSVLILHAPSLHHSAHELAQRIVDPTLSTPGPEQDVYAHRIANKYYTASVQVRCLAVPGPGGSEWEGGDGDGFATKRDEQDEREADSDDEDDVDGGAEATEHKAIGEGDADPSALRELLEEALADVPAVIWLFDSFLSARPAPALLQTITTLAPPIQLAVRVPTSSSASHAWSTATSDGVSDSLLDLGFQYIDAAATESEDQGWDEEALQEVREALEVHMWEGMERRGPGAGGRTSGPGRNGTDDAEGMTAEGLDDGGARIDRMGDRPSGVAVKGDASRGMRQLKKDEDGFVDFEAWLDLDEASGEGWEMPRENDDLAKPEGLQEEQPRANGKAVAIEDAGDGFDDAFHPFQSGPAPATLKDIENPIGQPKSSLATAADEAIPEIDPTALLQHLQSVRSQLAGVASEDERRRRAAQEVQTVFRGMGIDLDLAGAFDDQDGADGRDMVDPGLGMDDTGFGPGEDEMVKSILRGERDGPVPDEYDTDAERAGKEEADLAELMKALGV